MKAASYVVFWLESGVPQAHTTLDMIAAMKFTEALIKRRDSGAPITHVTSIGEHPESVKERKVNRSGTGTAWKADRAA